jgi:hypothetical protein
MRSFSNTSISKHPTTQQKVEDVQTSIDHTKKPEQDCLETLISSWFPRLTKKTLLVHVAKILLPFCWGIAYSFDSLWRKLRQPGNQYCGFFPALLLPFYFLCYDHRISSKSMWYDVYYLALLSLCQLGDIIWFLDSLGHGWVALSIFLLAYIFLDAYYLVSVWRLGKLHYKPLIRVNEEGIFLIIARSELVFALYLPILINSSDIQLVPINAIGYFIVFEFFGKSYHHMTFRLQKRFWLFSIFAVISALCEWIHIAHELGTDGDDESHAEGTDTSEVLSRIFDFLAAMVLYSFIINSFKKEDEDGKHKKRKKHIAARAWRHLFRKKKSLPPPHAKPSLVINLDNSTHDENW